MTAPTKTLNHPDHQVIYQGGAPAFVVIPFGDYQRLTGQRVSDEDVYVPHDVVSMMVDGLSPIAAWRKYKKLSQKALAGKLGISQSAMAQIEKAGANPQRKTLERVAAALGVSVEQLTLDD